jgi:hypothetical protein
MIENLEVLRNLIIKHFNIDVINKSRVRDIVDCKKIFTLIAFKEVKGFTYTPVSKYLGLTHASLIHHVKSAKDLYQYDARFREMYLQIESQFFIANKDVLEKQIEAELILLDIRMKRLKEVYAQHNQHNVAV